MKKVNLIGGVDSFGVAYTRDNKEHIGHLDIVKEYLENYFDFVEMVDMYSMNTYNNTAYINELLNCNLDFYTIKSNQRDSIDLCRKSGLFQFIQLPKKTKDLYILDDEDKKRKIGDFIGYDNTIFVYSCGVNDFLGMMDTDLGKMLSPKNMRKVFEGIDITVDRVVELIRGNFEKLLAINSELEIYVLGVYIPTKYSYIRKMVTLPIEKFNAALCKLCSQYDTVHFVDNSNLTINEMASVDWHPNRHGQQMIGENIVSIIESKSKVLVKK